MASRLVMLARKRRAYGISGETLARTIGHSQAWLSRVERQAVVVADDELDRLEKALDLLIQRQEKAQAILSAPLTV